MGHRGPDPPRFISFRRLAVSRVCQGHTTLPPTKDWTHATLVTADWRHERFVEGDDWAGLYQKARASLIETFLTIKSQSTQQVLYTMGHRLLNEEEVLYPSDRPYGLMEGTILRDDAPEPGLAW